ncbi:MAG: DcaP family trimeric outer membrane transporter [Pseudomonadales bacterium]|nr:DcaP family trimeric outer membrane transporter [Pseudomonadales bacterium]
MRRHVKIATTVAASMGLLGALPAIAGYEVELGDGHKIAFGGYLKADLRYVDGDVAYQDYWLGNAPSGTPTDTQKLGFSIRESRFNTKYTHNDVSAFLEFDLYGGGGNEVVSNSTNPRIRHAFIKYKNFLVGQTWSTFMNTSALPETLDFAGPTVAEVFIRQSQIRYSINGFDFAIENPETNGDGDVGASSSGVGLSGENGDLEESTPDLIAKYTFKGDWGHISTAAMVRKVDQGDEGIEDTATALSIAGKIMLGKDDFRFQVNVGEPGRYVGPALTADIVTDPADNEVKVEETTAFAAAYRHIWQKDLRSTLFYGTAETDILERERTHWGINLIKDLDDHLSAGVELGNFEVADSGTDTADSNYLQMSLKFTF